MATARANVWHVKKKKEGASRQMDGQTVWNTSPHTFIKSSSCSWPRAARWTPSPVEAVYVAAGGGRHPSLKCRLKRVHKLFMSVIIWHQPAHELREVQEHLLRGHQARGRPRSEQVIYPSMNLEWDQAGWLQQEGRSYGEHIRFFLFKKLTF